MFKHLQTYVVHYAAMIAGVCAIIAKMSPATLGPQGAAIIGAAATGVAIAHALGLSVNLRTVAQVTKAAVVLFVVAGVLGLGLTGCVTTQAEQMGLATISDAAVVAVVQKGNPPPAVMRARAEKIKQIALQAQAMNKAGLHALPVVIAAAQPLLASAGLTPAELILANQLVQALSLQLQAQLGANPNLAQVQTTVSVLLNDVIAACAAYGA